MLPLLCIQNKIILAKTALLPILLYSALVWAFLAKTDHNILQILIHKLVRKTRNGHRYLSNVIIRNDLRFLPVKKLLNVTLNISLNVFEILTTLPLLVLQIRNHFYITVGNGPETPSLYNIFSLSLFYLGTKDLFFPRIALFAIFYFWFQRLK